MTDATIRLALVGCGRIAKTHMEAIAQVPSPGPTADRTRLVVTREYLRAVRTTDRRGRPRWLSTPIESGSPLRVGEGVLRSEEHTSELQ